MTGFSLWPSMGRSFTLLPRMFRNFASLCQTFPINAGQKIARGAFPPRPSGLGNWWHACTRSRRGDGVSEPPVGTTGPHPGNRAHRRSIERRFHQDLWVRQASALDYRVADLEPRSAVLHTSSPNAFGHEHMADRAQGLLWSHHARTAV